MHVSSFVARQHAKGLCLANQTDTGDELGLFPIFTIVVAVIDCLRRNDRLNQTGLHAVDHGPGGLPHFQIANEVFRYVERTQKASLPRDQHACRVHGIGGDGDDSPPTETLDENGFELAPVHCWSESNSVVQASKATGWTNGPPS